MKVKMLRSVVIVGGAEDEGDARYERESEYEVNDTLGESMLASGQAVALEESEPTEDVAPIDLPRGTWSKDQGGPPENK